MGSGRHTQNAAAGHTRRYIARGALGLLVALTISCQDDVPSEPSTRGVQPSPNATAVQGEVPSGEAVFAELSQKVPSASGFFFDAQGRIIVNVADPKDGPNAVLAVRSLIDRRVIAVPIGVTVPIIWRQVKYSFTQLSRWRDLVFDSVFMTAQGIESLDLDEKNNVIRLGAQSSRVASAEGTARTLLARTGGDPSTLVVVTDPGLRPSFLPSMTLFHVDYSYCECRHGCWRSCHRPEHSGMDMHDWIHCRASNVGSGVCHCITLHGGYLERRWQSGESGMGRDTRGHGGRRPWAMELWRVPSVPA